MKILKLLFILTLTILVGGIIVLVLSKKNPKTFTEKLRHMMKKMCEKMMSSGICPMDCCKKMMEKHCK